MPQQRNLFAVGAEALINSLAEREMAKRDADYQAKKDARQAEIDAQNQQMRDLQMEEMKATRAKREQDDRQKSNDRAKAAMDEQEVNAMIDEYGRNPTPVLAAKIKMKGGHVPEAPKAEKPNLVTNDGIVWDLTDPSKPKRVVGSSTSARSAERAEPKDDPRLPNAVQAWLVSKRDTGITMAEFNKYVKPSHPNVSWREATDFFQRIAGKDMPFVRPGGEEGVILDAAGNPVMPTAGGTTTAAPGTSPTPTPTMSPVAGPMSDPETTAAVAELMKRGKEVTPESIAMAKQILRGGK